MRNLFYQILSLAVILSSIESSSKSDDSPDVPTIPGTSRNETCSSLDLRSFLEGSKPPRRSRSRSITPSRRQPSTGTPPSRATTDPRPHPPLPTRSIVPPTRLPCNNGQTYGLQHLEFIRLTLRVNPSRIFELRRYTFSAESELKLRLGIHKYQMMGNLDQIVMSTPDGDVFAILEDTNYLAGIYYHENRRTQRAKINMGSSIVTPLTPEEVKEIPVGRKRPISAYYKTTFVNCDS